MIQFDTVEFTGRRINSSRTWAPSSLTRIEDCVDSYNRNDNHFRSDWLNGLKGLMCIGDCVLGSHNPKEVYLKALKPSKRHSHQACLTTEYVRSAVQQLSKDLDLNKGYADFEEIYKTVCDILDSAGVKGIGRTTRYDLALRLAYYHQPLIEPAKYLYLHAGAAIGFKALSNPENKWLPEALYPKMEELCKVMRKEGRIPMEAMKEVDCLYQLGALHLENVLCAYDSFLNRNVKKIIK
jgi:hypothetical protein